MRMGSDSFFVGSVESVNHRTLVLDAGATLDPSQALLMQRDNSLSCESDLNQHGPI